MVVSDDILGNTLNEVHNFPSKITICHIRKGGTHFNSMPWQFISIAKKFIALCILAFVVGVKGKTKILQTSCVNEYFFFQFLILFFFFFLRERDIWTEARENLLLVFMKFGRLGQTGIASNHLSLKLLVSLNLHCCH